MKVSIKTNLVLIAFLCYTLISCEDFLEIDAPDHKMISQVVFDTDETARSAMDGIYNQLFRASFSSGSFDSVTILAGLSGGNISPIYTTDLPYVEFEQHEILPNNFRNLNLWSSTFNIIYLTNSLFEGIENSDNISDEVYNQLKGEASFVRAFTYFYLVNLYGEVPLILTTNYQENALASRNSTTKIYEQIINDLQTAEELLGGSYRSGERTKINRFAAVAMLARVHLYLENWKEAERLSSEVIAQSGTYEISEDLNEVFLSNSKEAIWQLSPEGRGSRSTHTNEGSILIIDSVSPSRAQLKLAPDFVATLDTEDKRLIHWIDFNETLGNHFAYKYKIRSSSALPIEEFSVVLRLAEQYLIRAETRAMQNDLVGAIEDLDIIRNRADRELIANISSAVTKTHLLDLIVEEREKELFTEWGHRWLDLKRTGKAGEILGNNNPTWQVSDILYPIPEEERMKNPNLPQNNGY